MIFFPTTKLSLSGNDLDRKSLAEMSPAMLAEISEFEKAEAAREQEWLKDWAAPGEPAKPDPAAIKRQWMAQFRAVVDEARTLDLSDDNSLMVHCTKLSALKKAGADYPELETWIEAYKRAESKEKSADGLRNVPKSKAAPLKSSAKKTDDLDDLDLDLDISKHFSGPSKPAAAKTVEAKAALAAAGKQKTEDLDDLDLELDIDKHF